MSIIDAGVGIALLWLTWRGFMKGLIGALVWLTAATLTPYAAGYVAPPIATWLGGDGPVTLPAIIRQPAAFMAALTVSGIVIGIGASLVFGQLRNVLALIPGFSVTDKFAGAAIGAVTGVVGLGLVTLMGSGMLGASQQEQLASSVWGGTVMPQLTPLTPYALALSKWLPGGQRLGGAGSQGLGLLGAGQDAPAGTAQAANLLLQMLANNPALAEGVASTAGMPAGTTDVARQFLQGLTGEAGTGTSSLSEGNAEAVKALLAQLAAGGTTSGALATSGTADPGAGAAAKLLLEAMSGTTATAAKQ